MSAARRLWDVSLAGDNQSKWLIAAPYVTTLPLILGFSQSSTNLG